MFYELILICVWLQYPDILGPVIESIEAISNKCKTVFEEMTTGILEEHYQILEVNNSYIHT